MPITFRVPRSTTVGLREDGIWFEEVPDLSAEVEGEPDEFWEQAQTVVEFAGYTADLITLTLAAREVPAFLARVARRIRGLSPQPAKLSIEASGLKALIELDLDKVEDAKIEQIAELIRKLED